VVPDYNNLTQCEALDDIKLNLVSHWGRFRVCVCMSVCVSGGWVAPNSCVYDATDSTATLSTTTHQTATTTANTHTHTHTHTRARARARPTHTPPD
jgi:hypothetical protein